MCIIFRNYLQKLSNYLDRTKQCKKAVRLCVGFIVSSGKRTYLNVQVLLCVASLAHAHAHTSNTQLQVELQQDPKLITLFVQSTIAFARHTVCVLSFACSVAFIFVYLCFAFCILCSSISLLYALAQAHARI